MKLQFDRHNGAVSRNFKLGDRVMCKVHAPPNAWKWTEGTIVAKHGKVMFGVNTTGKCKRFHKNQLRKYEGKEMEEESDEETPLNILMEMFELSSPRDVVVQPHVPSPPVTPRIGTSPTPAAPVQPPVKQPTAQPQPLQPPPPRQSTRATRPPARLNVDPAKPSYK